MVATAGLERDEYDLARPHDDAIPANLGMDFTADAPGEKLVSDITKPELRNRRGRSHGSAASSVDGCCVDHGTIAGGVVGEREFVFDWGESA
jgi:hypothetical protein